MIQAHVFISGTVQGVGFRYFIRRNARKLSITGWVRNLPDGRVEAVFQGKKESSNELIAMCRKGPFLAEIKSVDVTLEAQEKAYPDFFFN